MSAELLVFPCEFPLKVMGRDTPQFRARVVGIVQRHAETAGGASPITRASRNGKYVSLSFTLLAQSRAQLDALYGELSSAEEVLWVL